MHDFGIPYVKISYIEMNVATHPIIDISPMLENRGMGIDPIISVGLRWSPDGQWIVLNHGSAGGIASSDGNTFTGGGCNPRWKNDSSQIISANQNGIYFFNPNNNNSGILSLVNSHVAVYSPDDQYIIYADEYALRRMKSDDTQHTILVYGKATDPVWKPTGDKIAYVSWDYHPSYPSRLTGIHIINSDGSNPIQVIGCCWASNPRWQP